MLGYLHQQNGQYELAEPLLKDVLAANAAAHGVEHDYTQAVVWQLASVLIKLQRWEEAATHLGGYLRGRERKQPDAWTTNYIRSVLGGALLGQKKYADAEPLLLKGYEGMKAREKTIPPQAATRIPEALDRLIELYTATNRPDEAAKWRAERAKYAREAAPPPREAK